MQKLGSNREIALFFFVNNFQTKMIKDIRLMGPDMTKRMTDE